MELIINEVAIPEQITFNYEELKAELTDKVKTYETLVYSDEQIKEAKADKAALNKLKKALNDERIRREKEYMQPFNSFKAQINEIIGIIDRPLAVIDAQVKSYEEKQKQEAEQKRMEEAAAAAKERAAENAAEHKFQTKLALKAAIFNAVADFVVGFTLGALVTNFDRILPWLLSLF